MSRLLVHFSDFFNVSPKALDTYGAFNVSLISDIPLFVDPFLLFNSKDSAHQELHAQIIRYLSFLRQRASGERIRNGSLEAWYKFSEIKQTWLGYSGVGNKGHGLGNKFAQALHDNLHSIFSNFGAEEITRSSHLEKLCLISEGVGRDSISDFTVNLIKGYLLDYTQGFALGNISEDMRSSFKVDRVRFNYQTEAWESGIYDLPTYNGDFVLLTPKDILTKDETWINKSDLLDIDQLNLIVNAVSNDQLRSSFNNYVLRALALEEPNKPTREEISSKIREFLLQYPVVIDHYIRNKEDRGEEAAALSEVKVGKATNLFVLNTSQLATLLKEDSAFYRLANNSYDESHKRIAYLKDIIENKGGHRLFYVEGVPVRRESDLQTFFRLVWYAPQSDISAEVNDGRGPVDFKISRGVDDKTLVEFKLASNSKLKRNLQNQLDIYVKASDAQNSITVILCFTPAEVKKVHSLLTEFGQVNNPDYVIIDASRENKPSGSTA